MYCSACDTPVSARGVVGWLVIDTPLPTTWHSKLSIISWLLRLDCCRLLTCLYTSGRLLIYHNEWYSMSNDEMASAIGREIQCS